MGSKPRQNSRSEPRPPALDGAPAARKGHLRGGESRAGRRVSNATPQLVNVEPRLRADDGVRTRDPQLGKSAPCRARTLDRQPNDAAKPHRARATVAALTR